MEKSQWYTQISQKVIGTCAERSPLHRAIRSVVKEQLAEMKNLPNVRFEKPFRWGGGVKTIDEILRRFPTCPPDAFFHLKEFYQNKHINKFLEDSRQVKIVLRNWCATLNDWTISDYVQFYNNDNCKPYFNAYGRNGITVYYTPGESFKIAVELLEYQFDNDYGLIVEFFNKFI